MSDLIRIANCRGKKPVIKDITKALNTLAVNEFEMNVCDAKETIRTFRIKMEKILIADNPNIIIYK